MPLDLTFLFEFAERSPLENALFLFLNGGYIIFIISFLWMAKNLWLKWRRTLFAMKQQFILLAVDVPTEADQSPKAVEQIFAQLSATLKNPNMKEKWIDGFFVTPFSFELVSMEGHIQYLIHTPAAHRDFIESIVYAQYPDAEVQEVQDYATMLPTFWPDGKYDMWGTELLLANKDYVPIKTYPHFEHQFYDVFADPLASLLETMGKIGKGEYVWFQIVVTAISDDWKKTGEDAAKKMAGQKVAETKASGWYAGFNGLLDMLGGVLGFLPGFGSSPAAPAEKEDPLTKAFLMTPGEKTVVEQIQMKVSKIGFSCKVRLLYWGEKSSFSKRRLPALIGALKQYTALNLNGFKPDGLVTTKADYFRVVQRIAKRQYALAKAYKDRDDSKVHNQPIILNTEELASLWHFPAPEVRSPLIKRSEGKKINPPQFLPDEDLFARVMEGERADEKNEVNPTPQTPENLPIG